MLQIILGFGLGIVAFRAGVCYILGAIADIKERSKRIKELK